MSDLGEFEEALDEAARESDISREEALKRAIVALAEANDVDVPGTGEISELESRLDAVEDTAGSPVEDGGPDGSEALREDVDDLRDDVEALREDLDEKIRDLRSRVVRIYRETEDKAPAEHDHPELTSAVEDLRTTVEDLRAATADSSAEAADVNGLNATVEELDATVGELGATVDELDATAGDMADRLADLEANSEAFADRLESVESAVEDREEESDVSEKLSRVASAVVGVQRRLRGVERRTADAETIARLTATANRKGIRKATCEHCGEPVRISLLSKPRCPHCDREFSRLEAKSGFFGTSRLVVGDPPALEGQVADADSGSDAPTDGTTADGSGKR